MRIFAHAIGAAAAAAVVVFFGIVVADSFGYYEVSSSGGREAYWMSVAGAVTATATAAIELILLRRKKDKVVVSVIDVGTSKIVAIIADAADEASFQVLGVGVVSSRGMFRGAVKNPPEVQDAIREAVRKAEHAAGREMKAVYIAISEKHKSDGAATVSLRNCVSATGVRMAGFVPSHLASGEAVLRKDEKEAGVLMADIGAGTTNIALIRQGSVLHAATLPVGGYQVSRDLSIGLGVPLEIAEEIKKKYGSLEVPQDKESASSKIDRASVGLDNGQEILTQDVNDIVRARMDEILRMIRLEIPSETSIPGGVVLAGGTSNLPGIEALASDIFRMPVRIGVPKDVYGLADILYDPAYATAVGLLFWGAQKRAPEQGNRPRIG